MYNVLTDPSSTAHECYKSTSAFFFSYVRCIRWLSVLNYDNYRLDERAQKSSLVLLLKSYRRE